jgi:hypothetical protein
MIHPVFAQMMRNRFYNGEFPQQYGNMMWGWGNAKAGSYLWWLQVYHIAVAVLFLIVLILVVLILWKKLQLMDYEEKKKR